MNHPTGVCRCSARWGGEHTCHCIACHLTFESVEAFDTHRIGTVRRRCRTEKEMRKIGFGLNRHGYWRSYGAVRDRSEATAHVAADLHKRLRAVACRRTPAR